MTDADATAMLRFARSKLPIDAEFLPFFEGKLHRNAYLFDFYRNGSLANLEKYNGISEYDAWELCKDSMLLLKTATVSMEQIQGGDAGFPNSGVKVRAMMLKT